MQATIWYSQGHAVPDKDFTIMKMMD